MNDTKIEIGETEKYDCEGVAYESAAIFADDIKIGRIYGAKLIGVIIELDAEEEELDENTPPAIAAIAPICGWMDPRRAPFSAPYKNIAAAKKAINAALAVQ